MSRRNYLIATLGPQLAVAFAVCIWAIAVKGRLPDPIATHFTGIPMRADGYGSYGTIFFLVVIAIALIGIELFGVFGGSKGAQVRFLTGISGWASFQMSTVLYGTVWPQVGLASAKGLVIPGGVAALIFSLPLLGGVCLALVTPPPSQSKEPEEESVENLDLPAGVNAVWFGSARISAAMAAIMAVIGLSGVVIAGVAIALEGVVVLRLVLGVTAALTIMLPFMLAGVKVRVDGTGVRWRTFAGIPRGAISYDQLEAASVIDLKPGSWGGWGWRVGPDGTAIVIRGGEALHLKRKGKHDLFITVDDARTGAALIREHL